MRSMEARQTYKQKELFQPWLAPVKRADELPDLPEPTSFTAFKARKQAALEQDMQQIDGMQREFNKALGITNNEQLAYNPVLARWKYEQCHTEEERKRFKIYETKQIETAMRERWQTAESSYAYLIDANGKLRSEYFPDEPFEDVLMRGVKIREKDNSPELEREYSEVVGMLKIESMATDPDIPSGTKVYSLSRPSAVKGSSYEHNFLDEFTIDEDEKTKKRSVKVTRHEIDFTDAQCEDLVKSVHPTYFDNRTGSIDAWYLANPFVGDIMPNIRKKRDAMQEEVFQKLVPFLGPAIIHMVDTICAAEFNSVKSAEAWDALLAESDEIKRNGQDLLKKGKSVTTIFSELDHRKKQFVSAAARATHYARQDIQEVKAGCGKSGRLSSMYGGEIQTQNSVSQFAEKKWFHCPKCNYDATGPIGNTCPDCGLTKEAYAEETGIVCD